MPRHPRPSSSARALAAAFVTTLSCFVTAGLVASGGAAAQAPAPDAVPMEERLNHWAWQPLRDDAPPTGATVGDAAAGDGAGGDAEHPVDAFVRARLAEAGLAPSEPAAPHQQLRRLWLDLVGLPPPPEAVERFLADPSDAAWRREVDALLASEHYGERWARHWLDLMRYCETLGHEYDFEIPNAWRYRDYVIRAFDQDVPYDQFVREHLAGDLLPEPRRDADGNDESVQATASWWFVEQTHSPVDAMQHQADRVDNQLDVLGKAFLGMTVACARCHDHKFDPIPTRDYYSLFGYVQSSRYVQAPLRKIAPSSDGYRRALATQQALVDAWLPANARGRLADGIDWRPEDEVVAHAETGADDRDGNRRWYLTNDGFGDAPWDGPFCPDPDDEQPTLHRLPGPFWLSAAAGAGREGTLATPTFPLDHRYVHVRVAGRESRVKVIVDGFHVVRDPIYGSLHKNVNDPVAHWITFDVEMWRGRSAYVQAIDQRAPDLGDPHRNRGRYPNDAWLAVQCVVHSPHASPPQTAPAPSPLPSDAARTRAEWRAARAAFAEAAAALPVSPTLPALADGNGVDSYVYLRGSHRRRGDDAPRRFLSAVPHEAAHVGQAPRDSSGRLQLAEALLADDNPLPARVLVNRLWHHLFGRGIVKSVDNFGALGEPPTHPALLDWMARAFVADGWSVKRAIRRIVTSRTYRQSSRARADAADVDPDNLLVHRQNVRRLEAEIVRDALLAVSGRLSDARFGRSIEQPKEAITEARGRPRNYDPRDGRGRRSVYLAVRRNFMPEFLLAFDQPTPFATVGRRNTSNVPAQSLALANAPLVHDLCELFARRVIDGAADDAGRVDLAYRLAFARPARTAERARVRAFVAAPVASGDDPSAEDLDADALQLRRWTDVVHALVNTTDFRFRR